jgi:hypothetical protein
MFVATSHGVAVMFRIAVVTIAAGFGKITDADASAERRSRCSIWSRHGYCGGDETHGLLSDDPYNRPGV